MTIFVINNIDLTHHQTVDHNRKRGAGLVHCVKSVKPLPEWTKCGITCLIITNKLT